MHRGLAVKIGVALAAVGSLGLAMYAFFWDPTPTYRAAAAEVAPEVTDQQLADLAETRVYFGHMSVGKNLISGLQQFYAGSDAAAPSFVEIEPGEAPSLEQGGVFVHSLIGENRHPYRKLENFERSLRGGLADQVDVALLKFCYIDVRWDVDVDRLFTTYRDTMAQLERDFPDVRFLHLTVPLTTGPYGIKDHLKIALGRDDNAARERYNQLMRDTYGPDQLLDLAAVESRAPDGTTRPELYSGYSSDGAHLNATGAAIVAAEFMRLVPGPAQG